VEKSVSNIAQFFSVSILLSGKNYLASRPKIQDLSQQKQGVADSSFESKTFLLLKEIKIISTQPVR
jgi:hypothetical protein